MILQQQTGAPGTLAVDEIRIFLAVLATTLRETVVKFEETAARVTDLVARPAGRPDRDLVVTLQNFDRMQQEFATIADVLMAVAAKPPESWLRTAGGAHPAEDAIAKIPIAALKERLLHHLGFARSESTGSLVSEEAVF